VSKSDEQTIVTPAVTDITELDWSEITFDEAMRVFEGDMVEADAETMGDGFVKLPTKDQLIGVPFFIVRGTFTPGIGPKGEKVTLRVITDKNLKFFFSDGSAGIYTQLRKLCPAPTNTFRSVKCPKGLRASRFHWDEKLQRVTKDGEPNAATYYIDVSG
jgi:hypothetical protein